MLFLLLVLTAAPALWAQAIEQEVLSLQGPQEIAAYWQVIQDADQAHRGLNTIDSLDNVNLKKVILMIEYHGYPKGNLVPNLVFTHQRSAYVREYYFPILLQAWEKAEADTFWFMRNVRGLHRGRFARDFVEPDAGNYRAVLDRVSPWVADSLSYDLAPFDSLYSAYLRDVRRITDAPPVRQWATPENDRTTWYEVDGVLYTHKVWRDGSYAMPQPIAPDPESGAYNYLLDVPGTYLRIGQDGALRVYAGNREPNWIAPVGGP
jgi:hypothetical protein